MATHYVREICKYQPIGPFYLGGYSMGGKVAYEMTRQLQAAGENVALLVLIDAYSGQGRRRVTLRQWFGRRWPEFSRLRTTEIGSFLVQRLRNAIGMVVASTRRKLTTARWRLSGVGSREHTNVVRRQSLEETNSMAVWAYRMQPLEHDAVFFKGELHAWDHPDVHDGWKSLILGDLEIRTIAGRHFEVMSEPYVQKLAAELVECLRDKQSRRPR